MTDAAVFLPYLDSASEKLSDLEGHILDVLSVRKPHNAGEALGWAPVISKLSPLLGNLLEYEIVRVLNELDLPDGCEWVRQDPGFPDAALLGLTEPPPGIEIKAWFPLATEITGRFRESQVRLRDGSVRLAVICWLPEYILFGRPTVLGVFVEDALSIAVSRDNHYFQPPRYLVREPEDTSARTKNLRQTNTNGFRCQETGAALLKAEEDVAEWPDEIRRYSPADDVQSHIRDLLASHNYRLDTNYAKIDRIDHPGLESFKAEMLAREFHGDTVLAWSQAFARTPELAAERIVELAERAPD